LKIEREKREAKEKKREWEVEVKGERGDPSGHAASLVIVATASMRTPQQRQFPTSCQQKAQNFSTDANCLL